MMSGGASRVVRAKVLRPPGRVGTAEKEKENQVAGVAKRSGSVGRTGLHAPKTNVTVAEKSAPESKLAKPRSVADFKLHFSKVQQQRDTSRLIAAKSEANKTAKLSTKQLTVPKEFSFSTSSRADRKKTTAENSADDINGGSDNTEMKRPRTAPAVAPRTPAKSNIAPTVPKPFSFSTSARAERDRQSIGRPEMEVSHAKISPPGTPDSFEGGGFVADAGALDSILNSESNNIMGDNPPTAAGRRITFSANVVAPGSATADKRKSIYGGALRVPVKKAPQKVEAVTPRKSLGPPFVVPARTPSPTRARASMYVAPSRAARSPHHAKSTPTSVKSARMMICPGCSSSVAKGNRFCGGCGSAIVQACPSCTAHVPLGDRFCGQCGADQNPAMQHKQLPASPPASPVRRTPERVPVTTPGRSATGATPGRAPTTPGHSIDFSDPSVMDALADQFTQATRTPAEKSARRRLGVGEVSKFTVNAPPKQNGEVKPTYMASFPLRQVSNDLENEEVKEIVRTESTEVPSQVSASASPVLGQPHLATKVAWSEDLENEKAPMNAEDAEKLRLEEEALLREIEALERMEKEKGKGGKDSTVVPDRSSMVSPTPSNKNVSFLPPSPEIRRSLEATAEATAAPELELETLNIVDDDDLIVGQDNKDIHRKARLQEPIAKMLDFNQTPVKAGASEIADASPVSTPIFRRFSVELPSDGLIVRPQVAKRSPSP